MTRGKYPTYGDLVREYVALNRMERFEKSLTVATSTRRRVPGCDKGVTRAEAIAAWTELKELDVPRTTRLGSRRERSGDRLMR